MGSKSAHAAPSPVGFKAKHQTGAEALTCSQLKRVGRWSAKRLAQGKSKYPLESAKFGHQVAKQFLKQLDPYRLLFTANELRQLQKNSGHAWQSLLTKADCSYFESWVAKNFEPAKARFNKRVQAVSLTVPHGRDFNTEIELDNPKQFAKTSTELKERAQAAIKELMESYSPTLARIYQNNPRNYVVDSLNQLMFEQKPVVAKLLAKAMLESLDRYSTYFTNNEFDDFYSDLSGGNSGIGIQVRKVPTGLFIEKVLEDSSAGRSQKLAAGDVIIGVDGLNLQHLPSKAAKYLLKGESESTVRLKVQKKNRILSVSLKRELFSLEEGKLQYKIHRPEGKPAVAMISIPTFYGRGGSLPSEIEKSSSDALKAILKKLKKNSDVKAIVLDLRGNPGGYLDEAVTMASFFVGEQPIVGVVENQRQRIYQRFGAKVLYSGPLLVLVDEDSASASEVLAGALKDHGRALIIGSAKTFGKGSIQRMYHLDEELGLFGFLENDYKGVVKVTTSRFYSPLGHTPENGGVLTDVVLPSLKGKKGKKTKKKTLTAPDMAPLIHHKLVLKLAKNQHQLQKRLAALGPLKKHSKSASQASDSEQDEDLAVVSEAVDLASRFAKNSQLGAEISQKKK